MWYTQTYTHNTSCRPNGPLASAAQAYDALKARRARPSRTFGGLPIYITLCDMISWRSMLYYSILYYTIIYYTLLYYTILYYAILYYTILYYTILLLQLLPHLTEVCLAG